MLEEDFFVVDTQPARVAAHLRYDSASQPPVAFSSGRVADEAVKPNVATATPLAPAESAIDVDEPDLFVVDSQPAPVADSLAFSGQSGQTGEDAQTRRKRKKREKAAERKEAKRRKVATEEDTSVEIVEVESLASDEIGEMEGLEVVGELEVGPAAQLDPQPTPADSAEPSEAEGELFNKLYKAYEEDDEGDRGRYWVKKSRDDIRCSKCRQLGHIQRNCPNIICLTCGSDEHEFRDCLLGKTCNRCGLKGHLVGSCYYRSDDWQVEPCPDCRGFPHTRISCALRWRRYIFQPDLQPLPSTKGKPPALFCYNCAANTHLGDDCPLPRGHPMSQVQPTPFRLRPINQANPADAARARRPNIVNGVKQDPPRPPPPQMNGKQRQAQPETVVLDDSDDDLLAGSKAKRNQPPPKVRPSAPPIRFNGNGAPPTGPRDRGPPPDRPRRRFEDGPPPPKSPHPHERGQSDVWVPSPGHYDRRNGGPAPSMDPLDPLADRYAERPPSNGYRGPPPMNFVRAGNGPPPRGGHNGGPSRGRGRPQYSGGYF